MLIPVIVLSVNNTTIMTHSAEHATAPVSAALDFKNINATDAWIQMSYMIKVHAPAVNPRSTKYPPFHNAKSVTHLAQHVMALAPVTALNALT